jgi:hypothetical protein
MGLRGDSSKALSVDEVELLDGLSLMAVEIGGGMTLSGEWPPLSDKPPEPPSGMLSPPGQHSCDDDGTETGVLIDGDDENGNDM